MNETVQKRKLSRRVKVLIWVSSLTLAYTLAGFLLVPAIIKSQMVKRLPPITKRQAAIRQVAFNPFMFSLSIRGLALTETNGEPFAGFEGFHFQFQALASLWNHAWVFKDVTISNAFAHVIRLKDGSFNFDNLVPPAAPPPANPAPPSPLPVVLVQSLRIDGARVEADDLTVSFHDILDPINLQITNLTTRSNLASVYTFSAATDAAESFSASGSITVQPLQSSGNVKAAAVLLKRYNPYLPPFTKAQLADGKVDAGLDYHLAIGPTGPDATVTNGTVQLTSLQVKSPDPAETVVSIPTLTLNLAEAGLAKKMIHVSSIKSSGGSLLVRQNHDGSINLLSLLVTNSSPAPTPSAPAPQTPWVAQVDDITFDGYGLAVEDRKPAQPVKLDVSALAFSVKGFTTAGNPSIATTLSMRLNGPGSLSVHGTVTPAPLTADLTLDLSKLDLPPFAPYLPDDIKLVLAKGQLNVQGRAQCALKPAGPDASFAGDVSIENFDAADAIHDRTFAKFDALKINGIEAGYPALKVQIREIILKDFNADAVIDTNRQINLLTVLPTNAPAKAAASSTPAPMPDINLGALVIDKAAFHFVDESLEPHATFDLQELSGSIKGISSQPKGPAAVDFRGSVDQFSPFHISGSVDPLAKDITLDLAVSFTNVELTSMSPYMEKFGGHPLNKGKLVLQLNYWVAQRKLAATNQILVANLTLGPKNNSPDATHLPVKLGVALLKDRSGNIILDVPLSGSLDDPKFRIMPLIWEVVENLLAKAATSPFSLLAKLAGGGNEDLSSVSFPPGKALLAESEQATIQKLAKALYERPELNLEIAGNCSPALDGPVLAKEHLMQRIDKLRAQEKSASGQPPQSVEAIQLDPADYAKLLKKLYIQTFGTKPPAPQPSAPAVAAVPAVRAQPKPDLTPTFVRGGESLARHSTSQPAPSVAAAPPAGPAGPQQPAQASQVASEIQEMEQLLLANIQITDDELRDLEQARQKAVQSALLQSGQIPAQRIFLLAPKPIDRAAQGAASANFSLE